jgi:hypothetical protein
MTLYVNNLPLFDDDNKQKNLDNKLSLPLNIIMQYIGDFGHF